jgi:hypothetical protein
LGVFEGCGWVSLPLFFFFSLVLEWLGVGTSPFFVFRELRGVYKSMSFLKFFLEGWGVGRSLFLFRFLKVHGSMLCILNPQKKMGINTTPKLPNKKRVVIHPTTLQKQRKLVPTPTILQNPKKMMFSHSPLPSKNFRKKKGLVLTPNHKEKRLVH